MRDNLLLLLLAIAAPAAAQPALERIVTPPVLEPGRAVRSFRS
jgi:hypothetical protein